MILTLDKAAQRWQSDTGVGGIYGCAYDRVWLKILTLDKAAQRWQSDAGVWR